MSGVDDRIVSMKFDNAAFEQKLATTIQSLDKLRQSLDFANSTRGMNDLSAASKNFNMNEVGTAVEGISTKFAALATIGITTLATITKHAVEAGGRILKSMTLGPITQGFGEFELKMGSIQTIMAGSGASLEVVNKKLQELNEYSDKTIYSFKDMTSNIGKFTNAGVDLDMAVKSIQGVANVAALSGANAEEASRAMYNFSQALSQGSVKLIDWKSIELANMGTVEFKQQLIDSAVAMGTLTKTSTGYVTKAGTAVTATKGFNQSLQDEWLTSEALTKTLERFSDTTTDVGKRATAAATDVKTFSQMISTMKESVGSGWSQTFEVIFGNFEEGKKLWTGINNAFGSIVGKSSDARNNLLTGWKELGGRDLVIQGFTDAFKALGQVLKPIKEAFRDIFPAATAQSLFELSQKFADFAKGLLIGERTINNLKLIFKGLFAAISIGWEVIKGIANLFNDLFHVIKSFAPEGAAGGILDFLGNLGDTVVGLHKALVTGGGIDKFFNDLFPTIGAFFRSFAGVDSVKTGVDAVSDAFDRLGSRFEHLTGLSDAFKNAFSRLSGGFDKVKKILDDIWGYISTWFSELGQKLAAVMAPGDFNAAVDVVNVGLLGGIALMLKKFFKNGLSLDFTGGLVENVKGVLDTLNSRLKLMQTEIKAKILLQIAAAIALLTASVLVLSMIDSAALTKALTAMAIGFGQLLGVMALMQKMSMTKGALKLPALAAGLILLASAAVILSVAVKNLSDLSWDEIAKGLAGMTAMLIALTTATNLIAANTGGMIRAGVAMIGISIALVALSQAVKSFGELSWSELAKGLVGVSIGIGLLTAALNRMPPNMLASGLALMAIATGMRILAEAVQAFGDLSWSVMGKGLLGIGAGLVIVAGAMRLMPPHMVAMAAGLILVSVALNVMAGAIKIMGSLSIAELAKGLGVLAGMLTILSVALNVMTGTLAGSAALLVASGALLVLSGVMLILGGMDLLEIVKGLAAIAGVLILLGVGALVLGPLVPTLYALGVAMALIGVSFTLFGLGAIMVAKAFEIMAEAGKTGVGVLIEVIKMFIAALPEFIGQFIKSLAETVAELGTAGSLIVKVVVTFLGHVLDGVIQLVPKIGQAIASIVLEGLRLIRELYPEMLRTGIEILTKFLQGIRDNIYRITTLVVDIVIEFTRALGDNAYRLVTAAADMLIDFLNGIAKAIREKSKELRDAGINIATAIIDGMTFGLASKAKGVADAAVGVAKGAVSGVMGFLGARSPSRLFMGIGKNMAEGLAIGLEGDTTAKNSAVAMAERVVMAFQETLNHIPDSLAGMDNFTPVISPVLDLTNVQAASRDLNRLMSVSTITPSVSFDQARTIATTAEQEDTAIETPVYNGPAEIKFEQNIYSPDALSTNDIYRNTKSQIALAKEELGI